MGRMYASKQSASANPEKISTSVVLGMTGGRLTLSRFHCWLVKLSNRLVVIAGANSFKNHRLVTRIQALTENMMINSPAALEALPHICKRVCMIWGSLEFDAYINSLVMDSRDGERKGLPMAVGAELLWLQDVNKLRRALDIQERLGIGLRDAYAKVQMEDDALKGAESKDAWGKPSRGEMRREPRMVDFRQPLPRTQESTLFGSIYRAVTSKYSILLVVAIFTYKAVWPNIRVFFE